MNVAPFPQRATWLRKCLTGLTGNPIAVLDSACLALELDPALRDALAYDEMLRAPVLLHEIGDPVKPSAARLLTDDDLTDIQRWLQRAGLKRIAREPVRNAVRNYARKQKFHPEARLP